MPTVTFCTPPFKLLVFRMREFLKMPDLPVVFLPHPMQTRSPAEIEAIADATVDEVAQALTHAEGTMP